MRIDFDERGDFRPCEGDEIQYCGIRYAVLKNTATHILIQALSGVNRHTVNIGRFLTRNSRTFPLR